MIPKIAKKGSWKGKYYVEENGKIRGYSITELIKVLIKKSIISEKDLE